MLGLRPGAAKKKKKKQKKQQNPTQTPTGHPSQLWGLNEIKRETLRMLPAKLLSAQRTLATITNFNRKFFLSANLPPSYCCWSQLLLPKLPPGRVLFPLAHIPKLCSSQDTWERDEYVGLGPGTCLFPPGSVISADFAYFSGPQLSHQQNG